MLCPQCQSDNIQRLEVIYEGGTQNISASSVTGGVGGRAGLGAVTSTSGQSQSVLAKKLSPPAKKQVGRLLLLFPFVILAFMIDTVVGCVAIAAIVLFMFTNSTYNNKEWPALYQEWIKQWYCNKCGSVFKPD